MSLRAKATVPIIAAVDTASPAPSLALDFCGLKFASPIVLLSGCVGFGEEYTRVAGFSNRDAGAIVLKAMPWLPRSFSTCSSS